MAILGYTCGQAREISGIYKMADGYTIKFNCGQAMEFKYLDILN